MAGSPHGARHRGPTFLQTDWSLTMTERTVSVDTPGPVALDLVMYAGRIRLIAQPTLKQARVVLKTDATSGPSADAIRDTTVVQNGQRVTVRVPDTGGFDGGSTTIRMGNSTMTFSGGPGVSIVGGNIHISGHCSGKVFLNGREVTASSAVDASAPTPIEATVYLPARSEAQIGTRIAETVATGELARIDYDGSSGSLTADRVGDLDAVITSGTVTVAAVTSSLAAILTSGVLSIGAYSGRDARVNLTSGSFRMTATPQSSGRLAVNVTSGTAQVTGAGHLNVRRHVTSGHVHIG